MSESNRKCNLDKFTKILAEIEDQPAWRAQADKEADYVDGNQLDSAALAAQQEKGIPPSIENLIGPQILASHGRIVSQKKDVKVLPEKADNADDLATALNAKLNKIEKSSGADKACYNAAKGQIALGIDWVEVSRNKDPFKPPYRTKRISRNEIWWDMKSPEPDLSDAMWLLRRRWTSVDIAAGMFPECEDVIRNAVSGWSGLETELSSYDEGGQSTDLLQSAEIQRGWSVEEQEWIDEDTNRVCLFEVLTRHYRSALIVKTPDGRVVEFDKDDPVHVQAVASGYKLEKSLISDIYKTYYVGCHFLSEEKLENSQGKFNYIPFFYHREDRTGVPYGAVRGMMSLQDEHNARVSSMVWGLGSVRTTRTEGAVKMSDEDFRATIGRRDADIVLDAKAMAKGGIFEVSRDYQLNREQYSRMQDIRNGIKEQSLIPDAMRGAGSGADSASGLKMEIEQGNIAMSTLLEQFEYSRMQVMDMLLWMIIEDSKEEEDVLIEATLSQDERYITINKQIDEHTKDNDVSKVRLQVALSDVASSPSLAQQELMSLTEFAKSSMPELQRVLAPYIANLVSIPDKKEIVEAIKVALQQETPEQIEERVKLAKEEGKQEGMYELKSRELDIKEGQAQANIEKIISETIENSLTSFYSATQAAMQVSSNPALAPLIDQLLKSAGFEDKDKPPIVPVPDQIIDQPEVVENTSPQFPPRVQEPDIEQIAPEKSHQVVSPGVGVNEGIETPGVQ